MEFAKDMLIIGESIYIKKHNALIFSDLHIGYEEALNKRGILVPRTQFRDIIDNLNETLRRTKAKRLKKVIINGDLKHEFGTISETEWRQTLRVLDLLLQNSEKVVLVKGNHDTILGPIAKKRNVELVEEVILGDVLVLHGDREVDLKKEKYKKIKTVILGHEHPAVSLKEGSRVEKYKCFLFGRYKGKELIVMPSMNPIVEGTDVLAEELLSPFLKDISGFKVVVVDKFEKYDFGKVRDLE